MYLMQIDDEGEIKRIGQELGSLHDKAPQVMASAINSTALKMNTLMKRAIKKTYTYNRADKLKKAFNRSKKATPADPSAIVTVTSETPHTSDFKITPSAPSTSNYGAAKAQILKNGSEKELVSSAGIKAFIARFSNGKVAVVQRVPGSRYGRGAQTRIAKYGAGTDLTKIKAMFGPSIPKMAAKVHEESVNDEMGEILQSDIQKQIAKVIAKQMAGK